MGKPGKTFADKVIYFNNQLHYEGKLPPGFAVINPFKENAETPGIMQEFYKKFYNDNRPRRLLAGINPSRHGAAVTGVPFTDTKRLADVCGIKMEGSRTHEPSSVFVYDLICAYGGAEKFFGDFYINSPFPLAIVRQVQGKWLNANYYDDKMLEEMAEPFMIRSMRQHIALGLDTSTVFVMGKKNAVSVQKINQKENLFSKMVVLEHPRFIQQYRSKEKDLYIQKYLDAFAGVEI